MVFSGADPCGGWISVVELRDRSFPLNLCLHFVYLAIRSRRGPLEACHLHDGVPRGAKVLQNFANHSYFFRFPRDNQINEVIWGREGFFLFVSSAGRRRVLNRLGRRPRLSFTAIDAQHSALYRRRQYYVAVENL